MTSINIETDNKDLIEKIYNEYKTSDITHVAVELPIPEFEDYGDIKQWLKSHYLDFYNNGKILPNSKDKTRSGSAFSIALSLYKSGMSDGQVLKALYDSPIIWEMSLGHRRYNENKAIKYIWKNLCVNARASVLKNHSHDVFNDVSGKSAINITIEKFISHKTLASVFDLDNKPPEQPMVIHNVLPASKYALLAGLGGSSKSMLCLAWGLQVTAGENIMKVEGWDVDKPGKALYFTAEEDAPDIRRRLWAWGQYFREQDAFTNDDSRYALFNEARERLHIVPTVGTGLCLSDGEQKTSYVDPLKNEIIKHGIDLVVFDPLASYQRGMEVSPEEQQVLVDTVREIATETGACVLLVHHTNKQSRGSDKTRDASAVRGATNLTDGARVVFGMGGMTESEATNYHVDQNNRRHYVGLECSKANYFMTYGPLFFERGNGGILIPSNLRKPTPEEQQHAMRVERNAYKQQIIDSYKAIIDKKGFQGKTPLVEAMHRDISCLSRSKAKSLIDELIEDGDFISKEYPKNHPKRKDPRYRYAVLVPAEYREQFENDCYSVKRNN